jgi:signal peptidase I
VNKTVLDRRVDDPLAAPHKDHDLTGRPEAGKVSDTDVDPYVWIEAARPTSKSAPLIRAAAGAITLALTALAVLGLRAGVAETVRIDGASMVPTLQNGQVVVVNKLDRIPERGDLITLRSPLHGGPILKRAVGLGGDVVEIRDAVLFVNGAQVKEPYVDHKSVEGMYYGPVAVRAGSVLVMGDARANSIDSRSHGDVPLQEVTGTAVTRLWPPGPIPRSA